MKGMKFPAGTPIDEMFELMEGRDGITIDMTRKIVTNGEDIIVPCITPSGTPYEVTMTREEASQHIAELQMLLDNNTTTIN